MRLNSETPLLQGFMSHANEGFPDLTVQLGDHCGSSQDGPAAADSYYDSCNPLRGYATAADGVSIYYEIHGLEPGGCVLDTEACSLLTGCTAGLMQVPLFQDFGTGPWPAQGCDDHGPGLWLQCLALAAAGFGAAPSPDTRLCWSLITAAAAAAAAAKVWRASAAAVAKAAQLAAAAVWGGL
jgi:hypothetical protein